MEFPCPHCGELVELIDQAVLTQEYNAAPNSARRNSEGFPPYVGGGPSPQKYWWLRAALDVWADKQEEREVEKNVDKIAKSLSRLPENEQKKVREMLIRRLDGATGS